MCLVFLPASRVLYLRRWCWVLCYSQAGFSVSDTRRGACVFCWVGTSVAWMRTHIGINAAFCSGVFQDRAAGGHKQDVSQRPRHRFCSLCPPLSRHHRPAAERPRHQQNHSVRAAPSHFSSVLPCWPQPCSHVGFNADLHPVGVWSWSSMSR